MNNVRNRSQRNKAPWEGLGLAVLLATALLLISSFQTLMTFFIRMYQSDVMLGAVGGFSPLSRVAAEIGVFCAVLVAVHLLMALLVFGLVRITEIAWPALSVSRFGLVTLWFAAILAVVLMLNAAWYPRSHSGTYYHALAVFRVGTLNVTQLVSYAVLGLTGSVALLAAFRWVTSLGVRARVGLTLIVIPGLAVLAGVANGTSGRKPSKWSEGGRPNLVIIGIDSLRLEQLSRFGGRGLTPALDQFLGEADLFQDTTTPLARTFPSWVSILTGRAPRSTGANFNLVRREDVDDTPTLGDILGKEGYRTLFVTDEVRFSNIDESYGFDDTLTPPIGAADFLIGRVGDLPLSNVLANSPIGPLLFHNISANRAVAFLYQPASFIERLAAKLPKDGPAFIAIHLTAAHWPYFHADTPDGLREQITDDSNPVYEEGLQTADRMFGDVIRVLDGKGLLDNAVVVVLSDHGEALALSRDSLLGGDDLNRVAGLEVPARILNWGHGQSVLSPVQYQVLLSFRSFGAAAGFASHGRQFRDPASLEDIVPTVLDLLKFPRPVTDGVSHEGLLRTTGSSVVTRSTRVRFTETDVRVAPSADGTLDEDNAAKQAARLFAVDSRSGWLHLRPTVINDLMLHKERAAFDQDHLLAAMPVAPDRYQYLLLERQTGVGRVLDRRPAPSDEVASRLWDALHMHFRGELKPPVVVRAEDQADLEAKWVAMADSTLN